MTIHSELWMLRLLASSWSAVTVLELDAVNRLQRRADGEWASSSWIHIICYFFLLLPTVSHLVIETEREEEKAISQSCSSQFERALAV